MGFRPQPAPIPTSHVAQDVIAQTETSYKDVRKNAMQADIEHNVYYDKRAKASKFKPADYVYVVQPKADYREKKNFLTEFREIGSNIIEKLSPNNNYLLRKIGTDKTQVLHPMRLRHFLSRQPIPDVKTTPLESELDLVVSIDHDDLYARAWEWE